MEHDSCVHMEIDGSLCLGRSVESIILHSDQPAESWVHAEREKEREREGGHYGGNTFTNGIHPGIQDSQVLRYPAHIQ